MDKEPRITITLTENDYNEVRRAIDAQITHWVLRYTDQNNEHHQGAKIIYDDLTSIKAHFDAHYRRSMMLRGVK